MLLRYHVPPIILHHAEQCEDAVEEEFFFFFTISVQEMTFLKCLNSVTIFL